MNEEVVEIVQAGRYDVVQQQEAAALDVQVSTAKAYPRSMQRFESDLRSWARMTPKVAESCFYALPRGGKKLIGPSVRFAELVLASWGNAVVDAKVIAEEGGFVICDAVCRDLERNVAMRAQVRRRITNKAGKRFDEQVIESTIMAGLAIARRNAIMAVIPRALWEPIWEEAKQTAAGDAADFQTSRKNVLDGLKKSKIPEENWLHYVGRESAKDLRADDVLALRLALAQVESGESTAAELFPKPGPDPSASRSERPNAKSATDALSNAGKARTEGPPESDLCPHGKIAGAEECAACDEEFGLDGGEAA